MPVEYDGAICLRGEGKPARGNEESMREPEGRTLTRTGPGLCMYCIVHTLYCTVHMYPSRYLLKKPQVSCGVPLLPLLPFPSCLCFSLAPGGYEGRYLSSPSLSLIPLRTSYCMVDSWDGWMADGGWVDGWMDVRMLVADPPGSNVLHPQRREETDRHGNARRPQRAITGWPN